MLGEAQHFLIVSWVGRRPSQSYRRLKVLGWCRMGQSMNGAYLVGQLCLGPVVVEVWR